MSTVIVASSVTNKAKKFDNVPSSTTWGVLRGIISELIADNTDAVLSPGNVTLKLDSAQLPEGDYKIFLIPTKNKAGMTSSEAQSLGQEIHAAIIKAASITTTDEVKALKSDLIATIENFFNVSLEEENDCSGCAEALAEAKSLSNQ